MYYYSTGSAASAISTTFWVITILVGVVVLVLAVIFANKMQEIAESKGHKERYWAWCFWLPLLGGFMVAALPDLKARANYDGFDSDELPEIRAGANTNDSFTNSELPEL